MFHWDVVFALTHIFLWNHYVFYCFGSGLFDFFVHHNTTYPTHYFPWGLFVFLVNPPKELCWLDDIGSVMSVAKGATINLDGCTNWLPKMTKDTKKLKLFLKKPLSEKKMVFRNWMLPIDWLWELLPHIQCSKYKQSFRKCQKYCSKFKSCFISNLDNFWLFNANFYWSKYQHLKRTV